MEILAADNQALDELAEQVLNRAREYPEYGWPLNAGCALRVDVLMPQPLAVLSRVIIKAFRSLLSNGGEITSSHVSSVVGLIRGGRSGKHLELPGGIRVWNGGQFVVIDNQTPGPYEVELTAGGSRVQAGGFRIRLERSLPAILSENLIKAARLDKARTGIDWRMAVLDDSLVPDVLVIRPRLPGERARVIGQPGSNKLKKLMINHKIPVSRRAFWPLAFTRDGRYVWSPGLPPSVDFAANRETRSLAILRVIDDI